MKHIEVQAGDDILISFVDDTELTVYTSAYDDADFDPEYEFFHAHDECEVTVVDNNQDLNHLYVQFGDGTTSFIPYEFLRIVLVNGEKAV